MTIASQAITRGPLDTWLGTPDPPALGALFLEAAIAYAAACEDDGVEPVMPWRCLSFGDEEIGEFLLGMPDGSGFWRYRRGEPRMGAKERI